MSSAKSLESRSNRLYNSFQSAAARYGYRFSRKTITVSGRPNVTFLGNHSSGKSSFINHLLDGAPVQDTGVAPTDDGFTVILYGTTESDVYGPAAIARLPREFAALADLGPSFLQRLRVKVRDAEVLKKVNLIDSPGMVDSARESSRRDYDFMAAVRQFAEISDLVLFMFDPDKPGTTGETVDALSNCLAGIEFKLRILLNKCDTFDSMYDFARAYGALCWNLANVLHTKDLPTVYTTYLPIREGRVAARLDVADFDRHRGTVTEQVRQASHRRADNVIAAIRTDFTRFSMHVNIIAAVRRRLRALQTRNALAILIVTASATFGTWFILRWRLPWPADASTFNWRRILALGSSALLALLAGWTVESIARRQYRKARARQLENLDEVFADEYIEELVTGSRSDLQQNWQSIRDGVRNVLAALDNRLPLCPQWTKARLSKALKKTIPAIEKAAK